MPSPISLRAWIDTIEMSAVGAWAFDAPWEITSNAEPIIDEIISDLSGSDWVVDGFIAVHKTAVIETGAVIKSPAVIGPNCFVAANVYLRGGVWLQRGCTIGPSCEIKSTFVFEDATIAHLSFVGDSLIGAGVNVEAGAVVANHRNEKDDPRIKIAHLDTIIDTGTTKFGALIGDHVKIGANAVIAPGALLAPGSLVDRLGLIDQSPKKKARISILS